MSDIDNSDKNVTVFTNHPFKVTFECDVCPNPNIVFGYDSWFEHIVHHFFDSYLLVIRQFSHQHNRDKFLFPLTCGYETYTPFIFHISVPLPNGSTLQDYLIADYSSICGFMYFRSVLNSTAAKLIGFDPKDPSLKYKPLYYTVRFQRYGSLPNPSSFKKYELITIPTSYQFSHFLDLSPDSLVSIVNLYSNEIFNAFTTFIRFLSPKFPYFKQCTNLLTDHIPLFLDSRRSIHSGYKSTALKFSVPESGDKKFVIEVTSFSPLTLSSTKINFGEFLFTILEFLHEDSSTKHAYNLLLTLYYFCLRSSLYDQLLSNLSTPPNIDNL